MASETDSNGEPLWNRTYGGPRWDAANSVQQTNDGGYIAAGGTNSFGSGYKDFWLVKTDQNGMMQWNKTYGGPYDDSASAVQKTGDGFIVCGYMGSFGAGYEDFWLIKTDSDGNMIWNKTYGGKNSDYAYAAERTNDNGYIIAGSTYSSSTEFDKLLVKTDSFGNMQWSKTYGGLLDEEAYAVKQTNDGGYIIAGTTYSFGLGWDPNFCLIRLSYELASDLNKDGTVNTLDIFIIAKAFGSYPGHPRWNELADLDKNRIVNIMDIFSVARDYGKTI